MKLVSFSAAERSSYGAIVGGGIVALGRRLGARHPTLKAAIAGNALAGIAAAVVGASPFLSWTMLAECPITRHMVNAAKAS